MNSAMTLGQKIAQDAFDAFARWEHKYSTELDEVDLVDRPTVYGYWCEGVDIDTAIMMARVDSRT